jgi:hypothetical protein
MMRYFGNTDVKNVNHMQLKTTGKYLEEIRSWTLHDEELL